MSEIKSAVPRYSGADKKRRGMVFADKVTGRRIILVSRRNGNGHWNTRKEGKGKAHSIFEKTLDKYFERIT